MLLLKFKILHEFGPNNSKWEILRTRAGSNLFIISLFENYFGNDFRSGLFSETLANGW